MDACSGKGRAPNTYRKLLKRYAASEIANSARVLCNFNQVPLESSTGRIRHLIGFALVAVLQFDVVAASLTAPVPGQRLFSRFVNFSLKAAGDELFGDDVDGRELRDIQLARAGSRSPRADPADIPDADATDLQRTLNLEFYFAPVHQKRDEFTVYKRDGAIPLGAFKEDTDRLEFTVSAGVLGAAIAGLTVDAVQSLTLYGIYRDEEDVGNLDSWPFLQSRNDTRLEFRIARHKANREGRIRLAVVRHRNEDAGGLAVSSYAGIDTHIGGEKVVDDLSAAELQEQTRMLEFGEDNDLSEFLYLTPHHPDAPLSETSEGPIDFSVDSRGSQTATRYIVEEEFAVPPEARSRIVSAYGKSPETVQRKPRAPTKHISPDLVPAAVTLK